ncbi:MAG: hypothetical protein H7095_00850 [Pseudopedobacter sp.]|nr:hypothetical protein [Deinococcales bacterium]
MKNILKLAAALLILSTASVLATSAPVRIAHDQQPNTVMLLLPSVQKVRAAVGTARFTPPEFCYVGKMKVACTITDAPSKDPTKP